MATKNQITIGKWITYVIRIIQLTIHKQNCLEHVLSERVGIKKKMPRARMNTGFVASKIPK